MKNKIKSLAYVLGIVLGSAVLGAMLQFARAWTEPTAAPPASNIGAPITTGSVTQTKNGNLIIERHDDADTDLTIKNDHPTSLQTDPGIRLISRSSDYRIFANDESRELYFWDTKAGGGPKVSISLGGLNVFGDESVTGSISAKDVYISKIGKYASEMFTLPSTYTKSAHNSETSKRKVRFSVVASCDDGDGLQLGSCDAGYGEPYGEGWKCTVETFNPSVTAFVRCYDYKK